MLVAIEVTIFCHLTKADHQAISHNWGQLAGRASHRDLVPRGHDQRRLALLVHTAEPTCVGKQLTLLPITDAGGLAYLHRHTAARARIAVAGDNNGLLSLSLPPQCAPTPFQATETRTPAECERSGEQAISKSGN